MSKIKKILIGVSLFLILSFVTLFFFRSDVRRIYLKQKGGEIISNIEEFKNKYNQYPKTLKELGYNYDERGPFYYELKESSHYIIWFGDGLGESVTYDSQKKSWDF